VYRIDRDRDRVVENVAFSTFKHSSGHRSSSESNPDGEDAILVVIMILRHYSRRERPADFYSHLHDHSTIEMVRVSDRDF
jgi:hypothetical protein